MRDPIETRLPLATHSVRAVLAGLKNQMRVVMRPQPDPNPNRPGHHWWRPPKSSGVGSMVDVEPFLAGDDPTVAPWFCPLGRVGDRVWVQEQWGRAADGSPAFKASGHTEPPGGWVKSVNLARADCRLLLEVAAVRVQRLHDVTEDDALAEGVYDGWIEDLNGEMRARAEKKWVRRTAEIDPDASVANARALFSVMWEQDCRMKYPWHLNWWVWVVHFEPIHLG